MIKYADLGTHFQLNEIVMAGSHDAGITEGGGNARTQDLDIFGQAVAGVRVFDLRIAAFKSGRDAAGQKQLEMKAFHADDMFHKKTAANRVVSGLAAAPGTLTKSEIRIGAGTTGMGLAGMLRDARLFVTTVGVSEFLILKFDKCTNWPEIADMCRQELGNTLYTGGGNVNRKTLRDLAGKVIVAFMPSGYAQLKLANDRSGITPIVNRYKPASNYDDSFDGLQYWGAGGTNPVNNKSFDNKIQENIAKQGKIMSAAVTGVVDKPGAFSRKPVRFRNNTADVNVLGMMYWTSTGTFASIRDRNDHMWSASHIGGLRALWESGFNEFVDYWEAALPGNVDISAFGSSTLLKVFMPNIVMIDFADKAKCKHIYKLNRTASTELTKLARQVFALRPAPVGAILPP